MTNEKITVLKGTCFVCNCITHIHPEERCKECGRLYRNQENYYFCRKHEVKIEQPNLTGCDDFCT